MAARILIVEDERIVAKHVQSNLEALGYAIAAIVSSAEQAIQQAIETHPDLVLMDIMLQGEMDGVQAADQIRARLDIPVVYLTAYADADILQRAKITRPFGYILKPFGNRELYTAIEMALYGHELERKLRESEQRYRTLVETSPDSIMLVGLDGKIIVCNRQTAVLHGYESAEEMVGQDAAALAVPEERSPARNVWSKILDGTITSFEFALRRKDGTHFPAESSVSVITDANGQPQAVLAVTRDITERKRAEKALQRRTAQLALLNDVGQKIAAVLELESVLDRAARLVRESFGYHHVALFTVDRGRGELVMRAIAGDFAHLFPPDHRLKLGQGMVGWVGCHGERLLTNDVRAEPRYVNLYPDVIPTRAELSMPIRMGQEVVGVLDIQSPNLNAFDEGDVMVIETLADQIAVAIENARLYETVQQELAERKRAEEEIKKLNRDLEHRAMELAAIHKAGQTMASTLDPQAVLGLVIADVRGLLGAEGASVLLQDVMSEELIFAAAAGPGSEGLAGVRMPARAGIAGAVLQEKRPMLVGNAQSDSRFYPRIDATTGLTTRSLLAVPLMFKGQVRGVVEAINKADGVFNEHDLEILEAVADSAAVAIENARLFAAVQQELTERERAEVAQRESERRFREMLENLTLVAVTLDTQGNVTFCNDFLLKLTGWQWDEAIGQNWFDRFLPPEARDKARAMFFDTVLPGRTPAHYENDIITRQGERRLILWNNTMLRDPQGNIVGTASIGQDITERKQAEEEIKRRNKDLMALNAIATTIGQSPDLDYILNAALDKVLAVMEVEGGWIQLLDEDGSVLSLVTHRGLAEETVAQIRRTTVGKGATGQIAQTGQPVIADNAAEAQLARPDSPCAFTGVPIKSKDKVLGVLCISRGARESNVQEVQLLTAIGHQIGVAVENARLAEKAAEIQVLRELDRLRSELIANVSHELRTPLGLIKVFATTLLREDTDFDRETRQEFLRDIEEETDRLEKIVDNLLDLSRMRSGRLRLDKQLANLGQLARQVVEDMQVQFAHHRLVHDFPSEPLIVAVDVKRMEQVLRNLLSNACKYSPHGGVITVQGRGDERQLLIRVSDEGIGIPSEDLERVFERFYRVENEVTQSVGGVGLGLAVCRGIVEAHGGRIWAESALGKGSAFYFSLPVDSAESYLDPSQP